MNQALVRRVYDFRPGSKPTQTITTTEPKTATVVTETPEIVVSQNRSVTGTARPPSPPPRVTTPLAGVAPPSQSESASARLPKTTSDLPLIGLLGIWLVAIVVGLRAIRRLM